MKMLEHPVITETERTGYYSEGHPVFRCWKCNGSIFDGEIYLDLGDKQMCQDCVDRSMEVA